MKTIINIFMFCIKTAGYSALMFFVSILLSDYLDKEIIKDWTDAISWLICCPILFALPYAVEKNDK